MDFYEWLAVVSAGFLANILAIAFGFWIWWLAKKQQQGIAFPDVPLWIALCGAIPPLIFAATVAWVIY